MLTLFLLLASFSTPAPPQDPRARVESYDIITIPSDCVSSIVDQSDPGHCIGASSVPALGMLYPLSESFFVDPGGNVGIGTTAPFERLQVAGSISSSGFLMPGWGELDSPTYRFGSGIEATGLSSPFQNTITVLTAGEERMRLDGSGRLGIGTGLLGSRLTVAEDGTNPVGAQVIQSHTGAFTYGMLISADGTQNTTGLHTVVTDSASNGNIAIRGWNEGTDVPTVGGPGIGVIGLHDGYGVGVQGESVEGYAVAGLSDNWVGVLGTSGRHDGVGVEGRHTHSTGGGVGVIGWTSSPSGYGVTSQGNFLAIGSKSFAQPHPTDATREIHFVCMEGNESGTYFRGTTRLVRGRVVIEVPEEFRLVSEEEGLTVQLTPVGAPVLLWVESRDLEHIVVRAETDCEFDYFVNGIRRGYADFEPVHENTSFVPRVSGEPYGTQYPEEIRRILVENGTLNPDFTPNAATAQRNGWDLHDAERVRPQRSPRPAGTEQRAPAGEIRR